VKDAAGIGEKKTPAKRMESSNGTILVRQGDRQPQEFPVGVRVAEVLNTDTSPDGLAYIGALVNNDDVSLSFALEVNCSVVPITLRDHAGYRIYRRSLCFLLAKVVREKFPEVRFSIEHSIGTGFYCTFERDNAAITEAEIAAIESELRTLVENDLPIVRSKLSYVDAIKQFETEEQRDKFNLLRYRNPSIIVVYNCGNFSDLAHGVMASRTGMLPFFALYPYHNGFVLQFPDRDDPHHLQGAQTVGQDSRAQYRRPVERENRA
jgi:uridine kinase